MNILALEAIEKGEGEVQFDYEFSDPIKTKIEKIATKVYGADNVEYSSQALADIAAIEKAGFPTSHSVWLKLN